MLRSHRAVFWAGTALLCWPGLAIAQDALPDSVRNLIPTVDDLHLAGGRLIEFALVAVAGFAVGAFFSPLLRPFRTLLLRSAIALLLLYAVIGPAPAADILGWVIMAIGFVIAMGFGFGLGRVAARAAKRQRPTSFGSPEPQRAICCSPRTSGKLK